MTLANLKELTEAIIQCSRCSLREEATAPVPGLYVPNSKYFLLGQCPGKQEDKYGVPFIGQSGKRLNKLLEVAGIDINQCSLDNVVRCHPPRAAGQSKDRDPRKKEIRACMCWLYQALRLVKPEFIITLGAIPLSLFCPYGIKAVHGTSFEVELPEKEEV